MNFTNTSNEITKNPAPILIISKPLFPYVFPNKNLKAPLQGELTKYPSASSDTKKYLSFSCSAPMTRFIRDNFQSTRQRKVRSIQPCLRIVGIDKHPQKTGLIPPAPKIDSPNFTNIETCPKRLNYRYVQSLDKPSMSWIPDPGLKF